MDYWTICVYFYWNDLCKLLVNCNELTAFPQGLFLAKNLRHVEAGCNHFERLPEDWQQAKGLVSLAKELGFMDLVNVVLLGTDSTAAKSFVSRQAFGKRKHIE